LKLFPAIRCNLFLAKEARKRISTTIWAKNGTLFADILSKKHLMKFIVFIFAFLPTLAFSQSKEGYWDNIRTTNETFELKTSEKKIIKSADFPVGTTEVVYRITLLDDNQKISSSLVSVLKSIPDPTGISQGAAGGVFLLSTISGEDKCKYAVFTSNSDAENYIKTGKPNNVCIIQEKPINKEAKLLSAEAKCMQSNPKNLYFVFESDNYIFKEKVVLELVPWVNNKLSRGWNTETKKEVLEIATKLNWTKNLIKKDQFFALFIETIQSKYSYSEFKQMISLEKKRAIELAIEESLKKSGEIDKYYNTIRDESLQLFNEGKTNEAIDLITVEMIAKNRASYKDYGALGDYALLTKQFSKAEAYYKEGLRLNPSEIMFQLNLAHTYMFTNRLSEAKEIHEKYANQNLFTGKSWLEETKYDFKEFEKRGFSNKNFKKILRVIE
jgi:tetratricopeptide (TPR) repeat protein